MPFNVSEIADRIRRPGQSQAAVIERIRHWTSERLLSPHGKRNPGTGRHRLYDDFVLEDAALLNAMADMGLQIGVMRIALAVASQERTEWGEAKTAEGITLFLQIDFPRSGKPLPRIHFGGAEAFAPFGSEKSIVFNLTELFSRLKIEKE
jgi:DNA-binding transcriptional MerR regulator